MKYEIKDPEVLMLASIAGTLKGDYVREGPDDPWAGSPFASATLYGSSPAVGT